MCTMSLLSSYIAVELIFEQNVETSSEILSILGYKNELPIGKIGRKIKLGTSLLLMISLKVIYSSSLNPLNQHNYQPIIVTQNLCICVFPSL